MKIRYKVFLIFSLVACLAGFVAISSYRATLEIIESFEGGEEHFITIIRSAMEFDSNIKKAESSLMLFLTLDHKEDLNNFFASQEKLGTQIEILIANITNPMARGILDKIKNGAAKLQASGETLISTHASDTVIYNDFNPQKHTFLFKEFFSTSEKLMSDVASLVDQETNFLNKQFAITNAALISGLAKSAESKLLLYMTLNEKADLDKYMLSINGLKQTVERLKERLEIPFAKEIVSRIEEEVNYLNTYGSTLFALFHPLERHRGSINLESFDEEIHKLHVHASTIRELGLKLSNLMAEQEHQKKIDAFRTASSIQRTALFLVILGAIFTLFLGYILSATIAKPIIKLKEAAGEIGKGNLDAEIDIQGKSELSDLGVSFRNMARDLKTARDELIAAKEYTDNIIRSMSDALFVISSDGITVETVNRAACRLLGYDLGEIAGMSFPRLLAEPHEEKAKGLTLEALEKATKTGPIEVLLRTRDGEPRPVSFSVSTMFDKEGEKIGTVCVAQDMTERKKAVQDLRLFAEVINQATEAIVISSPEGNIQYVNPAFHNITGYSSEEIKGETVSFLKSEKHADEYYEDLWNTIRSGQTWRGNLINRKKSGSYYEEECSVFPVYDEEKRLVNYVSIKRDVTNERRLERQLQQSQRHQALGTLAGGIAHDFNNILSGMLAYVEASLNEIDPKSHVYANLQEVVAAGTRAADLVNQILTFSRPTKQERRSIELQHVIKGALKFIRGTTPSTIDIVERISGQCSPVEANPTQIHQVLVNLCANAVHAIGEKQGTITIGLEEAGVSPKFAAELGDLQSGMYVKLSVCDTGHGIDEKIIDRIFEPYFTTKKDSRGTGLGLSTVQGIVKSHGGAIIVESEVGKGTCFEVYLPKAKTESEPLPEIPDKITDRSTGGRIMFVDDETMIVQSMKIVLTQMGCQVDAFSSSVKALEAFQQQPGNYDLIITDQTMPKISGSELAKKVIEIRPDIPIILTTGFTNVIDLERAKALGIREFIMKPMPVETLKNTVHRLLAEVKKGEDDPAT